MALSKPTLEAAIKTALTPSGATQTVDQIAAKLATAIDDFVRSADVTGTATGVTVGGASVPVTGSLE